MAKILFINPVIRQSESPSFLPYGMAQLVALAVKEGHQVQVFDANAWRPTDSEICKAITADKWDVIAIGGLITTYGFIKKTVAYARRLRKKALIIAGGGFITPIPYEIMAYLPEIDVGVIGEGYHTLIEMLREVDGGLPDWSRVKGIIYRDKTNGLVLNEARPLLEDLDLLPFPAWNYFPLQVYFKNNRILLSEEAMLSKRCIGIMVSYGCIFRCKYCFHLGLGGELSFPLNDEGKREVILGNARMVRCHSPEYVMELVSVVKKKYNVDFVSFLDENLAFMARKKGWFDSFERLWGNAGLSKKLRWSTTAHAALVNADLLSRFRKLGCSHLDYGLESFSDEILRSIGKGATSLLNERALRLTLEAGIRPVPNQIIGFPDETFESIRCSMRAWKKLGIRALPFFATPYPGCEWYYTYKDKIISQYGGKLENFLLDLGDATKISAVISKNFSAAELLGLRELMVNGDFERISMHEDFRNTLCNCQN